MKLKIKPTGKQGKAWQFLNDKITRYILFGGAAGGGKTWLGCEHALFTAVLFPETRCLIGRRELKQLKNTTFKTFLKVCSHYNISFPKLFHYNQQSGIATYQNGSEIILTELIAKPSDPLIEDLGSLELTHAFIDEGGQTDFEVFDILKTRIGRCCNDKYDLFPKILICSNPKKNYLYSTFYKPKINGTLSSEYQFIPAFVDDNKYGEIGYKKQLESITDKATKERLLLGNWEYDEDPAKLIQYDKILDCFTNTFVNGQNKYISADIARFGSDKTIIMVWHGWKVARIIERSHSSITDTADLLGKIMFDEKISVSNVIVDEDGVGGGVKDILKCKGFVNNSLPIEILGKKENYANLKSQCYFKLAERINAGGMYIQCDDTRIREAITEELEQVKRKDADKDGKLAVTKKEEVKKLLGRSPDFADTLMMREYFAIKDRQKITGIEIL